MYCGNEVPKHSVVCPACGQEITPHRAKSGFIAKVFSCPSEFWPAFLAGVTLVGLTLLFMDSFLGKSVGVFCSWYGIKELKKCYLARKEGKEYFPAKARVVYIAFVVFAVGFLIYLISDQFGAVAQVKNIEFDSTPGYTVETILKSGMRNLDWSSESGDDCKYVYVYGEIDNQTVGFEFTLTSYGNHYVVSVTDVNISGMWYGELLAISTFYEMYYELVS